MLEAVNAVMANAQIARAYVGSKGSAASDVPVSSVASGPQAPYVSLFVHVDNNYDKAVLQVRDSDTGNVIDQYPSEETLMQRQRAVERQEYHDAENEARLYGESTANISHNNSYVQAQTIASDNQRVDLSPQPLTNPSVSAAIASASQAGSASSIVQSVSIDA